MSPIFNCDSEAEDVARTLANEIKGKNIFITGATVGSLGGEFIRVVAPYANTIWIAGRTPEKIQKAVDVAVKRLTGPKANIEILKLDMTSLDDVRAAAAKVNARGEPIHVVINNVATFFTVDLQRTQEGFESQWGVDHLAHFLLVALLYPRLQQASKEVGTNGEKHKARVVAVSSRAHAGPPDLRWDDPNFELRPEEYQRYFAYSLAKLANVIFAQELTRRAAKDGVIAFSLDPGAINTNGVQAMPKEDQDAFGLLNEDGSQKEGAWNTIGQGVANYVVAAFDPSIEAQAGGYIADSAIANERLNPAANEENGTKLWLQTEELLKIKFL